MPDDQDPGASDPGESEVHLPGIDPSLFADPDGGDPASEGADPGSLDDFAESFDAKTLQEEGSGGKSRVEDGKSDDARTPDPLDDFVAKNFKGDKNALIHSVYQSREEGKRLAEENKRLARELDESRKSTPVRDPDAELTRALESSREVQALNREIKSIESEDTALASRQMEIINTARTLTNEISQLEARLQHEDDAREISKLTSAKTEKKVELQVLNSEWNSNKSELKSNKAEKRTLHSDLKRTERDIKEEIGERESREESHRTYVQRQHRAFAGAFAYYVDQYGVKPDTKKFSLLHTTVKATTADYLDSLNSPDLDPQELAGIVGRITAATAEEFGLTRRSAAPAGKTPAPRRVSIPATPQRSVPARGNGNDGTSQSSKSKDDLLSDPDYIRKRATAVFQAAARRGQQGR